MARIDSSLFVVIVDSYITTGEKCGFPIGYVLNGGNYNSSRSPKRLLCCVQEVPDDSRGWQYFELFLVRLNWFNIYHLKSRKEWYIQCVWLLQEAGDSNKVQIPNVGSVIIISWNEERNPRIGNFN